MSTPNQATVDGNDSTGYAMLIIDELKLLLPQQQIKSLGMTEDMVVSIDDNAAAAGYLQFANRSWPIFCFSGNLTLLNPAPLNRRVCILLQTDSDFFGILCQRALLLKPGVIHPQSLPVALLTADSPIAALAIYDGEITSISSAEHLAKLLPLNVPSETAKLAL